MLSNRACGVLLHPTCLPSPFGIGDMGKHAYDFLDFLYESGQSYWQILPLEPIGGGNSPYSSCSAFAKNPLVISPEKLLDLRLLSNNDIYNIPSFNKHKVIYNTVIPYKRKLLNKAYENFTMLDTTTLENYKNFCTSNSFWLEDYSLYISIKEFYNGRPWYNWPSSLMNRNEKALYHISTKLKDNISFHKFVQFLFYIQWQEIKTYANGKNIKIIGDIPIFLSHDSVDVWKRPELFNLDSKGYPLRVSGVPPDYFSSKGQLWGNPLYEWEIHEQTDFQWWRARLNHILTYVDIARIDHFRGLESYWAIPTKSKNAINGKWEKAPGYKFLTSLQKDYNKLPIIAEDLGTLTNDVHILRDYFNIPGMAILQFAFNNNNNNPYLPHNCKKNTVLYTGTHDNDTTLGWYNKSSCNTKHQIRSYINNNDNDIVWKLIRLAYSSICNTVIIPMQDIQALDSKSRMNIPGHPTGNWEWRYSEDMISKYMIEGLNYLRNLYRR